MGLKAICKSHLICVGNWMVEAFYLNAVSPQTLETLLGSASSEWTHQGETVQEMEENPWHATWFQLDRKIIVLQVF